MMFDTKWIRLAVPLALLVWGADATGNNPASSDSTSTTISTSSSYSSSPSSSTPTTLSTSSRPLSTLSSVAVAVPHASLPSSPSSYTSSHISSYTSSHTPSYTRSAVITTTSTTRALTSTTTTSNSRGPITSCAKVPDLLNFLSPTIFTLPPLERDRVLLGYIDRFNRLLAALFKLQAQETITNQDEVFTRNNNLFTSLLDDVTAIFGNGGQAILSFNALTTDPCLYQTCLTQFLDQSSRFDSASLPGKFVYYPSAPCCGPCSLVGSGVELEYWPTPAVPGAPSTLVNTAENLTFISPSVYARFTTLMARNNCGQLGAAIDFTRLAFKPDGLSTSSFPVKGEFLQYGVIPQGNFTVINYADFDSPKCFCNATKSACPFDTDLKQTITNLCTPQIKIPAEVIALNTIWGSCLPNLYGLFDPPIALPRARGLSEPQITPPTPPPSPTTTPAEPVNTPNPPAASSTTPAAPEPEPVQTTPVVPNTPTSSTGPIGPPPETTVPFNPPANPIVPPENPGSQIEPAVPVPVGPPPSPTPNPALVITLNSETLTANAQSNFVIGTQTLVPGGPAITVSGTVISLAPGATELIVGGSTVAPSNFVIGTQTLIPGGAPITVSGTVISLAPGATELVVGSSTTVLASFIASFIGVTGAATSTSSGKSGVGGLDATATASAPTEFVAGVERNGVGLLGLGLGVLFSVLVAWL